MGYEDGVGTKMLRRAFYSEGSGVGGQGSGVKTEVTNWSNIEYKVKMTPNLDI